MKILKIFGIVVGIHAIALIMIFANPGCSSTGSPPPAPAATAPKADPAPVVSVPDVPAPAADGGGPIVAAPDASSPAAPVIAAGLFSPTRPGTLAASALEAQPVSDVTPVTTITVGRGDNLWSIAKKNHLKVSALARANGISVDSPLHLGQKLIIPGAAAPAAGSPPPARMAAPEQAATGSAKYRVRAGETLGAIARKLRVKLSDLATANNISDPQKIHVGQELLIPGKGGAGANEGAAPSAPQDTGATSPPPAAADSQDLDAGLKPAAAGDVPAIKIDDPAGQPRQQ